METQLTTFQKFMKFLFFPQIIANIFNALTMDEKGYSLKKILAVHGSAVAGTITIQNINATNYLLTLLIWLVWSGILVGIYSLSDITGAISKIKGDKPSGQ